MTLQALPHPVFFPGPWGIAAGNSLGGGSSLTVDGDGDGLAVIFQAPKTGNIRRIHFRTSSSHTTNGNARTSIQTVDATTGLPTGTLWATDTSATQSVTASATVYGPAFTADAAVTVGQVLAAVIERPAGSSLVSSLLYSSGTWNAFYGVTQGGFPYVATNTAAAWSKLTTQNGGCVIGAVEWDDGSIVPINCFLPGTWTTTTLNNGSSPDEIDFRIYLPFKSRAVGAWIMCDLDGDADMQILDSAGSQLAITASGAVESNFRISTSTEYHRVYFTAPVELSANTEYWLSIVPNSATSISMFDVTAISAAAVSGLPGGSAGYYGSRTNASGAPTGVTTRVPTMGLLLDQLDDGAGGAAGMFRHPGMAGGMNG